jgi:hypothetical protein
MKRSRVSHLARLLPIDLMSVSSLGFDSLIEGFAKIPKTVFSFISLSLQVAREFRIPKLVEIVSDSVTNLESNQLKYYLRPNLNYVAYAQQFYYACPGFNQTYLINGLFNNSYFGESTLFSGFSISIERVILTSYAKRNSVNLNGQYR